MIMFKSDKDLLIDEKMSLMRKKCELTCRATGETTRLIDYYIQELYKNYKEWILVEDHYDSKNSHKILINAIMKRMGIEHPQDKVIHMVRDRKHLLKLDVCNNIEYKKQEISRINTRLDEVNKIILNLS